MNIHSIYSISFRTASLSSPPLVSLSLSLVSGLKKLSAQTETKVGVFFLIFFARHVEDS